MNIGGAKKFEFGTVKFTQAFHSSSYHNRRTMKLFIQGCQLEYYSQLKGKQFIMRGILRLFGDMEMIGKRHPIDVAFLPIGDNFTMGPEDAAYAVELLKSETCSSNPFQYISTD